MIRNLLVALCLLGILPAIAQTTTIKGSVIDASTRERLHGASISFAGKGGTTTNNDGVFNIECGRTNRITISVVAYITQIYTIRNCNDEIIISLKPAKGTLNNVEITTTSNPNKSLLYQPASITKLSPVELKRGTGVFLNEAINANVPGVTMNSRSDNLRVILIGGAVQNQKQKWLAN